MDTVISLRDAFMVIQDPRINRTKKHNLVDIIVITLCSLICGFDGWEEIEAFAEEKEEWLKEFLELPNGIPSHDTFYRVFSRINPKELNQVLTRWSAELNKNIEGKIVAIDGKTLRGSFDSASGKGALHMVSAWVEEHSLCLGEVSREGRGHELAQIAELFKLLEIKKGIVTIDAIACNPEITRQICEDNKADYVISLKKNQPSLYSEVQYFFNLAEKQNIFNQDTFKSVEKGHGRIETRVCTCLDVEKHLDHVAGQFKNLKTVARIESKREIKGKIEERTRYFISSLPCDAAQIANAVRTHWSIENSLHWRLDVVYGEDASRIRKDHAPENLALIRRLAFSLVKMRLPDKMTVKRARVKIRLNWKFMEQYFVSTN